MKYKIIGRAGTGKTTYLINEHIKIMKNGVSSNNIAMTTFSRSAAQNYRERVGVKDKTNFRTMHSWCFKLLGLKTIDLFTKSSLLEFCKIYYDVDADVKSKEDKMDIDPDGDDDFFDALIYVGVAEEDTSEISKIKEHLSEISRIRNIFFSVDDNYDIIENLCSEHVECYENLMEFLDENGLFDFTKMLEEVVRNQLYPDVDYIFLDEFQDFTPLQFQVAKIWMDNIEHVYVAGDDMQAINNFAGADAKFFIELPYKEVKLDRTHRHGKDIFNYSQQFINHTQNKIHCDVKPAEKEGKVVDATDFRLFDVTNSTLIIAASNRWKYNMKQKFQDETGIEPIPIKSNIVEEMLHVYKIFVEFHQNKTVEKSDVELLLNVIPSRKTIVNFDLFGNRITKTEQVLKRGIKKQLKEKHLKLSGVYDFNTFTKEFLSREIDIANILRSVQKMKVLGQYKFPNPPSPPNVRYGTVHAAKGLEAHTVFFGYAVPIPAISIMKRALLEGGYDEARDNILRMGYVATSRAQSLHVNIHDMLKNKNGRPNTFDDVF